MSFIETRPCCIKPSSRAQSSQRSIRSHPGASRGLYGTVSALCAVRVTPLMLADSLTGKSPTLDPLALFGRMMDQDSFNCFLLESFSPHFFSHEAYDHSLASIRGWITEKEAFIHEEDLMDSPVLSRTFSFFDKSNRGLLLLPEVLKGIEKACAAFRFSLCHFWASL